MLKKNLSMLAVLVATVLISSCKKESILPDITKTIKLPANGDAIINANNILAVNFFKQTLQQDSATPNKMISPLSIYLALSMAYNGAANATRDSMAKLLQPSGINITDLNTTCQALLHQLPEEDNRVTLSIANSVWYNIGMQPLPSFTNTIQEYYQAGQQALSFGNPAAADIINRWVSDHTHNKIQKVVQSTSADDLLYLVNALYFDGAWKNGFDTRNTLSGNFYLKNGNAITVPYMNGQITTLLYTNDDMQLIELPYGSGKSYSMYIASPTHHDLPLSQFAVSLNNNLLANAIGQMDSTPIKLSLPKWEYGYQVPSMQNILSSLGMGIAFTDAADYTNMYSTGAHISKAIHKTYIKVNEEGTVAAAVTAIGFTTTTSMLPPEIRIDHPFIYLIMEKQTGAILFMGTVGNPALN